MLVVIITIGKTRELSRSAAILHDPSHFSSTICFFGGGLVTPFFSFLMEHHFALVFFYFPHCLHQYPQRPSVLGCVARCTDLSGLTGRQTGRDAGCHTVHNDTCPLWTPSSVQDLLAMGTYHMLTSLVSSVAPAPMPTLFFYDNLLSSTCSSHLTHCPCWLHCTR